MKRLLLALAVLVAVFFAGRTVYRALVSEETRITWLLDDMAEGFNETRMKPIMAGLSQEFLDGTYGADRDLVYAALVQLFLEAKDPATKRFPYRVEWKSDGVAITETAGDAILRAHMDIDVAFFESKGEAEVEAWKTKVKAELAKQDGEWRFTRTETATVSGELLR